ncbi:hypothetical protein IVB23_04050 [Bradyrhizobium sp. 191]|nr:hypothetical protein [Bradyrhizobium sp. 191]UPJ66556.1 hypothetical protein IVB23_04050 [Bradyrhizobium sp. 191]
MDRNEQSLKHAVADGVAVLQGDGAGERRGDAIGEVPGAEIALAVDDWSQGRERRFKSFIVSGRSRG